MEYRKPTGWYQLEHANLHNLKNVNVKLPLGVMTVIAGVAGSGKSSLMEYFTSQYPGEVISIRQKDIGINLRSTRLPIWTLQIRSGLCLLRKIILRGHISALIPKGHVLYAREKGLLYRIWLYGFY